MVHYLDGFCTKILSRATVENILWHFYFVLHVVVSLFDFPNPFYLCVSLVGSCWQLWWSSVFWLWPSLGRQFMRTNKPCSYVTLYSRAATRPATTKPSQSPTSVIGSSRLYLCAHLASASLPTLSISLPSSVTGVTLFSILLWKKTMEDGMGHERSAT